MKNFPAFSKHKYGRHENAKKNCFSLIHRNTLEQRPPLDSIAQLVENFTGTAGAMGSKSVQASFSQLYRLPT